MRPHEPVNPDPGNPETPAVRTEGLVRVFGNLRAVDGLDLVVHQGECLGLLGPNGAGKSTTVRMLATLLPPSAGRVRVLGLDPVAAASSLRHRIGLVPQEIALYEHLSGRENLTFFGRLHGLVGAELRSAVAAGLELSGLEGRAGDSVKGYSGGMKRRLNVAVALLHRPELVFLDEPTVGIDPQSRLRVFEMVESLRRGGTAVVYTSHQLGEVERLCDRIVILDRGREVAAGTLAELRRHEVLPRRGANALRFARPEEAQEAAALLAGKVDCTLEEQPPDLEEIFIALTGRALRDEAEA